MADEKEMTYKRERHIRWNWEKSPDNFGLVRYHFIVVDDKDRDMTMNRILEELTEKSGCSLIYIRSRTGKVSDCGLRYFFQTYDCSTNPSKIDFTKLHKPIKRDLNLKERVVGTIDNYVESVYGIMNCKTLS